MRLSRGRRDPSLDEAVGTVLDAAVAMVDEAVIVCDVEGRVVLWNNAAEEIYGWSAGEAVGTLLNDLIGEPSPIEPGGGRPTREHRHRDGTRLSVDVDDVAIWADDGSLRGSVAVSRHTVDPIVREWDALQSLSDGAHVRLARLALFDTLTGLPNLNALTDRIARTLSRLAPGRQCGLIAFSIDDFCDVRDTAGIVASGELLVALARRVELVIPTGTTLARTGREQFAVFCPDLGDLAECLAVTRSIQLALAAPVRVGGEDIFSVVSTGVTIGPAPDAETLIHRADIALTRSERNGHTRTVVFETAFDTDSQERLQITRELRLALDRGEMVAYYQPIIELATGRVVAVEALVRWNHPTRGLVPPDSFIPIAESTGLITELGAQVLDHACVDGARWLAEGRRLQIAVNASAVQLTDPAFADTVRIALQSSGLPPTQLSLEVTESAAFGDLAAVTRTLGALIAGGVNVALDDFGTGYSSLSMLKRLPVTGLKIDRTFIAGLGQTEDDRIVSGVVHLGLALGLNIVAEGVEHSEQATSLRSLGCQYGQGYLWSPAVPERELMAAIDRIEQDASSQSEAI